MTGTRVIRVLLLIVLALLLSLAGASTAWAAVPTVTSVTPNAGSTAGGTAVSIVGTGFTGATAVKFGGSNAANYRVVSATQITATTPAHVAGSVAVAVTTSGGTGSLPTGYTYVTPPTVSSVSPASGTPAGGMTVTISGANLTGASKVTFGGTNATNYAVVSATRITATTPAHAAGSVTVAVTTSGGTGSRSNAYQYLVPTVKIVVSASDGTSNLVVAPGVGSMPIKLTFLVSGDVIGNPTFKVPTSWSLGVGGTFTAGSGLSGAITVPSGAYSSTQLQAGGSAVTVNATLNVDSSITATMFTSKKTLQPLAADVQSITPGSSYLTGVATDSAAGLGVGVLSGQLTLGTLLGSPYTRTAVVTAYLAATSGLKVDKYVLAPDGVTYGSAVTLTALTSVTATASVTLSSPSTDGTRTVAVKYDASGVGYSAPYTAQIVLDTHAPTGTIAVAGGAAYTNSLTPTVDLSAVTDANGAVAVSGLNQMRWSVDGGATWSGWQTYVASATVNLSSGDGAKTVTFQFTDMAGNTSASISDGIVLDQTLPTVHVTAPAQGQVSVGTSATISGDASDGTGSGVGGVVVSIKNDITGLFWNGVTWLPGPVYVTAVSSAGDWNCVWTFSPQRQQGSPTYTIWAVATDIAGNSAMSGEVTGVRVHNQFTITASAGSNGSISPTGAVNVDYGADQTFTITAAAGCGIADVVVDGASVGVVSSRTFTGVTSDHSISATFIAGVFTLSYRAGSHGSVTGVSPQTVTTGGSGTAVTAVPDSGYHFVQWSDGLKTATRTDTNVVADIDVTAQFASDVSFTLTYRAATNYGAIMGSTSQTVPSGGDGSAVTAMPDSGYHFVQWSDGLTTATRTDTHVAANLDVTARFASDVPRTVLIVAPHPDDDIIYGSGVAANALAAGETVKVVYMTNGDYYGGVSLGLGREDAAVNAQTEHIGTAENDLLFLGYPDGYLQTLLQDYPNAGQVFTSGASGQSATYGDRGLGRSDYHFYRFGAHANYNGADVYQDLESIIATYRPADVYTTGADDQHPDHLSTYTFVRGALQACMAADGSFSPTLHTTVVHHDNDSWPQPVDPTADVIMPAWLPYTTLVWSSRESLRVPQAMQSPDLNVNPKYLALATHGVTASWGQFVHRDEVFWIDGLTPPKTNYRPTASAGTAQSVGRRSRVQLDGSNSADANGDALTYAWTQTAGPAVTLSNATAAKPTFTAPNTSTTLTFKLVVSDGKLSSIADSVTVTVS
jgi:LmbE family N-acetylglucosaminyl deacetylase